jgi:hypothetical protein
LNSQEKQIQNLILKARRTKNPAREDRLNMKISLLRREASQNKEELKKEEEDNIHYCQAPDRCFCLIDFVWLGLCGHCSVKLAKIVSTIQNKAKKDGTRIQWSQKTIPEILRTLNKKEACALLKLSIDKRTVEIQ